LFSFLQYPSTIRADAITAVGAPSTIAFLMRAIYWLYTLANVYMLQIDSDIINEAESREEEESKYRPSEGKSMESRPCAFDEKEQLLFQRILDNANKSELMFEDPAQCSFSLPNDV
jgi:hypothetical protein